MNELTEQVAIATREQRHGSAHILKAVDSMQAATRHVSQATAEQRQGGEVVERSVSASHRSAQEASEATARIALTSQVLHEKAEALMETIAFFQDDHEEDDPAPRPAPSLRVVRGGRRESA